MRPRLEPQAQQGGRCPSLADYVTGMELTGGAIAAGRVLELATLRRAAGQDLIKYLPRFRIRARPTPTPSDSTAA
jgi:hypothetical protein